MHLIQNTEANWLVTLGGLAIRTDAEQEHRINGPVLALAGLRGLTVYDAMYLEVAQRLGPSLATRDRQLRDAALASGVPLIDA
jgi:predicted nucleic acid-binding protein